MKITGFETVRAEELENLLWLQVETDEGIVGLGETYMMPRTVEAYIHEVVAPKLLGRLLLLDARLHAVPRQPQHLDAVEQRPQAGHDRHALTQAAQERGRLTRHQGLQLLGQAQFIEHQLRTLDRAAAEHPLVEVVGHRGPVRGNDVLPCPPGQWLRIDHQAVHIEQNSSSFHCSFSNFEAADTLMPPL